MSSSSDPMDPFGIRTASSPRAGAEPAGYLRTAPYPIREETDLDAQRSLIRRYAEAEGLGDVRWYADDGASGTDLDRIELRRLITDVADRHVSHVIVASMNRLSTRRSTLIRLYDRYLADLGIPLVSVTETIDTSTGRGERVMQMLRSFVDPGSEPSSAQLDAQARAQDRRREVAEAGGHAAGRVPYGYRKSDTGHLRVDADEAEVVRRIFQLRRDELSLRAIAGTLNDDAVPSPTGGSWRASTVSYLLDNEIYFGYRTYDLGGETLTQDVPHLQIVEQ